MNSYVLHPQLLFILVLVLWIVLPLIPAFVLFKALPTTGNLEGTFKGLELKFGGAFAGYLALCFLVQGEIEPWMTPPRAAHEIWSVHGNIRMEHPTEKREVAASRELQIELRPPIGSVSSGQLDIKVVSKPGFVEGQPEFPYLILHLKGYESMQIDLNGPDVTTDTTLHLIELKKAFVLRKRNLTEVASKIPNLPTQPGD